MKINISHLSKETIVTSNTLWSLHQNPTLEEVKRAINGMKNLVEEYEKLLPLPYQISKIQVIVDPTMEPDKFKLVNTSLEAKRNRAREDKKNTTEPESTKVTAG